MNVKAIADRQRSAATVARAGDVINGKYRVDSVLGSGGMAVVLGAFHLQLLQPVALKFLRPDVASCDVTRARFHREARALGQIESEHVARIMDVEALSDGTPFLVLEYLTGHDLGEELNRRGAFEPSEAVDLVLQACEAMAEAHAAGIIHRDLKPDNLFLAERADGSRIVKVIDFGISKVTTGSGAYSLRDSAVTRTTNVVGSPMYMSPEQLRSARTVDARSDVWSLGATLYELLSCRTPFVNGTVPEVCAAVLKDPIVPLLQRKPDLPPQLVAAVERALEKDPDSRYRDVVSFAQAIAPFAAAFSSERVARIARVGKRPFRAGSAPSSPDLGERASTLDVSPAHPSDVSADRVAFTGSIDEITPFDFAASRPPFAVPRIEAANHPLRSARRGAAALAVVAAVCALTAVGAGGTAAHGTPLAAKAGSVWTGAAARAANAAAGDDGVRVDAASELVDSVAATPPAPIAIAAAADAPSPSASAAPRATTPSTYRPETTASSRAWQARYFEHRK
jgi:serine/threonine-protein kinase